MKIAIAVCTFKRPDELLRCLGSIKEMYVPDGINLDIIVVDNAPSDQIANICQGIYYVPEPKQGLVFARNRVLSYVRQYDYDYVGIIDDDETVSRDWLIDMTKAFAETNADAVSGIIDIALASDMLDYLKTAYQFKKVKSRIVVQTLPMGNVMLNRQIINSDFHFDERFNFSGGEDIDFFSRLHRAGYKLYKIPNAQVTEYLTKEKASLGAYFKRQMRVAKLHYQQKYPTFSLKFLLECIVSCFEIMVALFFVPIALFNSKITVKVTKMLAKAIGRLLSRDQKTISAYGH